jgi:cytochrome c2
MPVGRLSGVIAAYIIVTITTASAAQVGSIEEGHKLAREMCAECHLLGEEAGLSTNANALRRRKIGSAKRSLDPAVPFMLT